MDTSNGGERGDEPSGADRRDECTHGVSGTEVMTGRENNQKTSGVGSDAAQPSTSKADPKPGKSTDDDDEAVTVEIPLKLSIEQEFFLVTGICLNNWYAIEVGLRETNRRGRSYRKLVEDIFWGAYNAMMSFDHCLCDWSDTLEYMTISMVEDLDVQMEDGSVDNIMADLYYLLKIIKQNDRSEITKKLTAFPNKSHFLTNETINYNELKITRVEQAKRIDFSAFECTEPTIAPVFLTSEQLITEPSSNRVKQENDINDNAEHQEEGHLVIKLSWDEEESPYNIPAADLPEDPPALRVNNSTINKFKNDDDEDGWKIVSYKKSK